MIAFDCTLTRPGFTLAARFATEAAITGLMGPSGSGKSTILRLIAGLERPERGVIRLGDETLTDTTRGVFIAPHKRRIGLLLQDALLFPHLSVAQNLGYGRIFSGRAGKTLSADAVIDTLQIRPLLQRRPATLSGGEAQRVALARALMAQPRLLLLDEPLAALDDALKAEILPFIAAITRDFGVPVLYVSHDRAEILALTDDILTLHAGKISAYEEVSSSSSSARAGMA